MGRKVKYQLSDYCEIPNTKSFERCRFYLVKRSSTEKYVDLVMDCDGFVFILSPKEFYSKKTHFMFSKMLYAIAAGKYDNEDNRATR